MRKNLVVRPLTELTSFRIITGGVSAGPGGEILPFRYLEVDGLPDIEVAIIEKLVDAGKLDAFDAIRKILTPCRCEECGGGTFVQRLCVKHGRMIEVLVCASGELVYTTSDRTQPCVREHSVVRGEVSGLTPSPQQIAIADRILSDRIKGDSRDKIRVDEIDPDQDGDEDFYDGEFR